METNTNVQSGIGSTGTTGIGAAGSTGSSMSGGQTSVVEETKQKVQEAASTAQHKIGEQMRTGVETGKTRAADTIGSLAQALTQSGQQLRQQNNEAPLEYVERAGEHLRRASEYLRNTNVDEIVHNTENFARRQPALFLAGAFAIGLLGARFLKSSQQGQQQSNQLQTQGGFSYRGPASSAQWTGDRERPVAGFRESGIQRDEFDSEPL
ncbi:MAG TPA: hypothetical protein VM099_09015 [Gemmatimonadaceae bacterium]|nr:hypothetical protein [Gemmatimonadaceae bacterium]